MKKEVRFFYTHGFEAVFDHNAAKVKAFNSLIPVIGKTTDYLNKESINELEQEIEIKNKEYDLIFVGTSLGGYFARYFAEKYNKPCILVNPSMFPISALKNKGYSKNKIIHIAQYISSHDNKYPSLLILAKDDNVVPYQETIYSIGNNSEIILKDSGGHRLENIASFMNDIDNFVQKVITK